MHTELCPRPNWPFEPPHDLRAKLRKDAYVPDVHLASALRAGVIATDETRGRDNTESAFSCWEHGNKEPIDHVILRIAVSDYKELFLSGGTVKTVPTRC